MTGIDIVKDVYFLLNVNGLTTLLGNGKVWQHNRPKNSPYTDVVISVPEYNATSFNTGYLDVNVHSPNLKEFYPIPTFPQDDTFPDLAKFKTVVDKVIGLLVNTTNFSLSVRIPGIPIRDKDGEWYVNIRVGFEAINPSESIPIKLILETSTSDGYGGANVALTTFWTGNATRVDIAKGSQLNIVAGRYEFNMKADWVLPLNANPQKNMQIDAPDGDYVINGIIPINDFWGVSTIRKDGSY